MWLCFMWLCKRVGERSEQQPATSCIECMLWKAGQGQFHAMGAGPSSACHGSDSPSTASFTACHCHQYPSAFAMRILNVPLKFKQSPHQRPHVIMMVLWPHYDMTALSCHAAMILLSATETTIACLDNTCLWCQAAAHLLPCTFFQS